MVRVRGAGCWLWWERLNVRIGVYAKSSGYCGLIWVVIVEGFRYKSEVGSVEYRFWGLRARRR